MDDVFHEGELAVQQRAGVGAQAQQVGRIISPALPNGADEYLAQLPLLIAGAADAKGNMWATVLADEPGFVRAPGLQTVQINKHPAQNDPVSGGLVPGASAGFLAIDLNTRGRLRFNGEVTEDSAGLVVHIREAFGNCPKYIQQREVIGYDPPSTQTEAVTGSRLTDEQRRMIRRADTFFIASHAPGRGADVSHRGGMPGFVTVADDRTLAFPDYAGNNMFQTLGNLTADPRAGLAFIDFDTGSTLQLSGRAVIRWDRDPDEDPPGGDRVVRFQTDQVVHRPRALPMRWVMRGYSPHNPEKI